MTLRINIESIPHDRQRYDTAGDWWIDQDGTWQIRVSEVKSWPFEFLLALHELVELALCWHRDILEHEVTEFDTHWKPFAGCTEPGDDMSAPYYHEHQIASGIERLAACELEVNWVEYCRVIDTLGVDSPGDVRSDRSSHTRPLPSFGGTIDDDSSDDED